MLEWLRGRKPGLLTGAPAVRRQKSYSAQSGYVYQYFYEGQRAVEAGAEFVFGVTVDRKTSFPVSVLVSESAVASWQRDHARALAPVERYAIAKMALFQAFDERPNPSAMKEQVRVRPADIDAILETLGIE